MLLKMALNMVIMVRLLIIRNSLVASLVKHWSLMETKKLTSKVPITDALQLRGKFSAAFGSNGENKYETGTI